MKHRSQAGTEDGTNTGTNEGIKERTNEFYVVLLSLNGEDGVKSHDATQANIKL